MPNLNKQEEIYLDQVSRIWLFFRSLKTDVERAEIIYFLELLQEIRERKVTQDQIKQILDNKLLLEYAKTENITYLINFTEIFSDIKSRSLKDKIMDTIEKMAR